MSKKDIVRKIILEGQESSVNMALQRRVGSIKQIFIFCFRDLRKWRACVSFEASKKIQCFLSLERQVPLFSLCGI